MKFVLMSEPAQKCENNALELFISLKMAISCYFCLRGNLEFPDFLEIKFYNINYLCVNDIKKFGGNLDFPKCNQLKKVCSNVWSCKKMWKQWMLFSS